MDLEVASGDPGDLSALYVWLARDPDVRRHARIRRQETQPQPSEMGSTLELINVALSNAVGILGLVTSVAAFWRSRTNTGQPALLVTITNGDMAVTVDTDAPEAIRAVVEALSSAPVPTGVDGDTRGR